MLQRDSEGEVVRKTSGKFPPLPRECLFCGCQDGVMPLVAQHKEGRRREIFAAPLCECCRLWVGFLCHQIEDDVRNGSAVGPDYGFELLTRPCHMAWMSGFRRDEPRITDFLTIVMTEAHAMALIQKSKKAKPTARKQKKP